MSLDEISELLKATSDAYRGRAPMPDGIRVKSIAGLGAHLGTFWPPDEFTRYLPSKLFGIPVFEDETVDADRCAVDYPDGHTDWFAL